MGPKAESGTIIGRHAIVVVRSLIINENFGHSELWHHGHSACIFALPVILELARPIHSVEESDDDVSSHRFFDSLEAGSATEELVQAQASVIVDDLVMRKDHEQRSEGYSSIMIAGNQHLLVELVHPIASSLNLLDGKLS